MTTGAVLPDLDQIEGPDDATGPPARRMVLAILALAGVLIAGYMSLYKLGVLGHIVCGTGGCETVQNSPWSVLLGIPVPYLGFVGYALMLGLALMGIQPGGARKPMIAVGLLVGGTVAFAFSLYLSWLEANVIHAWCRWCIGSAVVSTLLFLLALPELLLLPRRTHG